jgi:hypothetical protein
MKRNAQLRSHVSKQLIVGEARLNFQVLPDGPPAASPTRHHCGAPRCLLSRRLKSISAWMAVPCSSLMPP